MNVSSTSLPDGVDDGAQRCVEETSMNVSSTSLPDGVDDGAQRCVGETSMNVSSTLLPDGVDDGAQLCAEETSMNAPSTLHSNGVDDGPQLRAGETSINAPSTLLSDGVDDGSQLRVEEAIVNVPSTLHHDGVGDGPQPQVEETVVDVSTTLHQERVDETHAEAPQAQTSGDERQVPRVDPQEAPIAAEETIATMPTLQGHDRVQAKKAQKQVFKGRKRNEKGFWSRPSNDDDDTSHENLQVCSVGGTACSVGGTACSVGGNARSVGGKAPPRMPRATPRSGATTLDNLWKEGLRSSTHLMRAWDLFRELMVSQDHYGIIEQHTMPDMTLVLRFFNYVGEHGAKPIHGAPPALPQSGAATQVDAGDNTALVNLVSKGLRRSLEWSLAWYTYCDYYRDNIMDPMMH